MEDMLAARGRAPLPGAAQPGRVPLRLQGLARRHRRAQAAAGTTSSAEYHWLPMSTR